MNLLDQNSFSNFSLNFVLSSNSLEILYPFQFKICKFSKASARDLVSSKQSPIQEIGAMQKGLKIEMLAQGKPKFSIGMGTYDH